MQTKLQFIIVTILFISLPLSIQAQTKLADPELMEKYHLFDFWLGEWEVYASGTENIVGESHIMSINDSTALLENYETIKGPYKGKSLNTYNKSTGKWEQYWIDNGGLVLKLNGSFINGKMILEGMDGSEGNRISWEALEDGTVRQVWETLDKNKEWKTAFDGTYKPTKNTPK